MDQENSLMRLTQDEFAEAYTECYPRMWVIAASAVCDRSKADDILQEAAVVGLRKISQFKRGTRFDAWIASIVRFVASNSRRKAANRKTYAVESRHLDSLPGNNSGESAAQDVAFHAAGNLTDTAFDDQVLSALRDLNETARACLLLRTIHNLSFQEISELLEIPQGTAMSHVHRSKSLLRERLQSHA
ncbi:MAG: RNA polymerase sigma factor [Planctomycetota bacterium]